MLVVGDVLVVWDVLWLRVLVVDVLVIDVLVVWDVLGHRMCYGTRGC